MTRIDAIRTIRFAAGTTAAAAFAFGLDYSLAMITPVLASVFLGAPAPRPTLAAMSGIFLASAAGLGLGVGASLLLIHAPSILFLSVGLMLFRIFLAAARGTAPFLVLMLLIGVLLVPVVGTSSTQAAVDFAGDFLVALALSFVFVQLAFEFFPDPDVPPDAVHSPALPPPTPSAQLVYALQRTAIFLPLFAVIVALQWTSQLTALLFAAILSLGAQPEAGWKAGLPMLGGALVGGSIAVAIYLLTSMHHEFALFLLLVAFALLVIGRGQFSDEPSAVLWASSKSAMLILISSSSSVFGDETGAKFFDRLSAIVLAGAILAAGLPIAAHLFRDTTLLRDRTPRPAEREATS